MMDRILQRRMKNFGVKNWCKENAKELIELVGDEVIQYQLRQLYAAKFGGSESYRNWIASEARRLGMGV